VDVINDENCEFGVNLANFYFNALVSSGRKSSVFNNGSMTEFFVKIMSKVIILSKEVSG
jgi:hypothetical protein